jgi:hypothetical protein
MIEAKPDCQSADSTARDNGFHLFGLFASPESSESKLIRLQGPLVILRCFTTRSLSVATLFGFEAETFLLGSSE